MNRAKKILPIMAVFTLLTLAQAQTSAQADAQANGQTSIQANKNGAETSAAGSTQTSVSTPSRDADAAVNSGTAFNAILDKPVDAKKSKPGDTVTAHTTETKNDIPKGTKLVGHVTQASARAKGDSASQLGIQFDRAVLKNGQEVPFNAAIQAMAPARTADSFTNDDLESMSTVEPNLSTVSMAGGRGSAGGLTSAAGGTVGAVTHTTAANGGIRGPLNSTGGSITHVAGTSHGAVGGLNTAGQLTSNSRGVFTMRDLNLNSAASSGTQGSVITSAGKNVHLDGGTRLLMVNQATASATPNR